MRALAPRYHTNDNVRWLADEGIEGYLADNQMRKREPLFANAADHDPGKPMWGVDKAPKKPSLYAPSEFRYDEALGRCCCPAGKELRLSHRGRQGEYEAVSVRGTQDTCGQCDRLLGRMMLEGDTPVWERIYAATVENAERSDDAA